MSNPARKTSRPPVKYLHKKNLTQVKDGKATVHEEIVTHRMDGTIFVKFYHKEGAKKMKVTLNQKADGSYTVMVDGKKSEKSKEDAVKMLKSMKELEFALKYMKSQKLARARKRKAGPGSRKRRSRKSSKKRKSSKRKSKKRKSSKKRRSRKRK